MSESKNFTNRNDHPFCREGKLALTCFVSTLCLILLPSVPEVYLGIVPHVWGAVVWGPFIYYAMINMVIRLLLRNNDYQITLRASFLGFGAAAGILLILFGSTHWKQFGVYGLFMALFHFSEFLAIAWANPESLSVDSFILNHSVHYAIAAAASWAEFLVEIYFLPSFKTKYRIWIIGLAMCIFGEIVRKTAIITAKQSFTHLVQYERSENHKLITTGIYAYARHPSYAGWFWWSIGTQIILVNPLCIFLYAAISWKFFNDRIFLEEITLLNFFHLDYHNYQKKVPTGLPFIKGYLLED